MKRVGVKRVAIAFVAAILVYCLLQTSVTLAWNRSRFHSFGDVVFFMFFLMEDTTAYANQYSERGFLSIRLSMTTDEVQRIIGTPIEKQSLSEGGELWRYTKGLPDRNYWMRCVEIDVGARACCGDDVQDCCGSASSDSGDLGTD
ncbi:MAG: hypothetical protein JXR37_08905, partial [Kiritimatiellae bacterium]|nr:hypothetical protein [Kiritimatiellia bacterium]